MSVTDEMLETRRPLRPAMLHGLKGRCPNCGVGRMFRAFLKVADHCPYCGEELFHHRADDLPAYLVILAVGHIVVSLMLMVEIAYAPPYWVHLVLWGPLTLGLSLAALQPVKGAVVGFQWGLRMHGFDSTAKHEDDLELAPKKVSGGER